VRRNIPEDIILHSHRRGNHKSYNANVVPSLPILVTLMMQALSSSESSVLTRPTERHIPENGILFQPFFWFDRAADVEQLHKGNFRT
jgi:hypothetical protein